MNQNGDSLHKPTGFLGGFFYFRTIGKEGAAMKEIIFFGGGGIDSGECHIVKLGVVYEKKALVSA